MNGSERLSADHAHHPIRRYLCLAAWGLFIGFCLLELVYIPLFGVHTDGIPVPRWQMRPVDLLLYLIHSVSPALVNPVEIILFSCAGFGIYLTFRIISTKTVLEEPTRARIFNAIKEDPGIHFNALRHLIDINRGTLRYHLAILILTKKITCVRDGIFSRYLPKEFEISRNDTIVVCRFRSGPDRAMLTYLINHPNATQQEIGSAIGISPPVISWRVQRLLHEGIVNIDRQGRTVRVALTNEAEESIRKIQNSIIPASLTESISQGIIGQKI
ncbi:MAG: winged helix-turn-helix transcriptional regulator [Methanoregula sp.]|nr:winged helix-turn-helix transcriptional regulator [Methanoregula sp.]